MRHFITFPENLLTTSGLSILMHGVISLPHANTFIIMLVHVKLTLNFKAYCSQSPKIKDIFSKYFVKTSCDL